MVNNVQTNTIYTNITTNLNYRLLKSSLKHYVQSLITSNINLSVIICCHMQLILCSTQGGRWIMRSLVANVGSMESRERCNQ